MFAIVEISGKQFKVIEEQKLFVDLLPNEKGSKVSFDKVLLLNDGKKISIGTPSISGASVEGKVINHLKDSKVTIFKKKRRKGYRVKNGHRQSISELIIDKIKFSGSNSKKETKKTNQIHKKTTLKKTNSEEKDKINDLSLMTLTELKDEAKIKQIKGFASMKKADLITALLKNNKN